MSRPGVNCAILVLVALMSAALVPARNAAAKDPKPTSKTIQIGSETTLGGKQLKPGSYVLVVDETKVTLKQSGKVIAEAPAHWKDAPSKSTESSVISDAQGIREIHFEGKTSYLEIAD